MENKELVIKAFEKTVEITENVEKFSKHYGNPDGLQIDYFILTPHNDCYVKFLWNIFPIPFIGLVCGYLKYKNLNIKLTKEEYLSLKEKYENKRDDLMVEDYKKWNKDTIESLNQILQK